MPRSNKAVRADRLRRLTTQVSAAAGCDCIALPGVGIVPPLMRCAGPCPRCAELT